MPWRGGWRPAPDLGDRRTFQLIAEGLTQLIGFGVATISVVRGDELEVVAVAGLDAGSPYDAGGRTGAEVLGARWPVRFLEDALAVSEDWGRFRFLSHTTEAGRRVAWVVPGPSDDDGDPDAWHSADSLVAPVYDSDGALCGVVSLGAPVGGRRPDAARWRLMDKYAEQAQRAILTGVERDRLAAQARLLDTARVVVRNASRERSLDAVLRETGSTLRDAFGAVALWTRVFATGGEAPEVVQYFADTDLERDLRMAGIGERTACRLWELHEATVVDLSTTEHDIVSAPDLAYVHDHLVRHGYSALLCAPLGAGPECLGSLVILRAAGAPPYSALEIESARDIGRDLGRLLLTARTFQEEQRLVARLRELDGFKTELVARMADELSTPLKAIVHCVEQLRGAASPDPAVVEDLRDRTARMAQLVDDLLLLARVADRPPDGAHVDLSALVAALAGRRPGGQVRVRLPRQPVHIAGDQAALEWLLRTMTATALRFGEGTAQVALRGQAGTVELSVTTDGGDTPQLRRLLRHYFAAADPRVLDRPGTGLPLTLVAAIVHRHRGRIAIHEGPGAGLVVTFPSVDR